jgi:hypothetical protein
MCLVADPNVGIRFGRLHVANTVSGDRLQLSSPRVQLLLHKMDGMLTNGKTSEGYSV